MGKVQQTNENIKTHDIEQLKAVAEMAPEQVAFELRRLADVIDCMTEDELIIWKEYVMAQIIAQATEIAQNNVKSKEFDGMSFVEASLTVAMNIVYSMSNAFSKKVKGEMNDDEKEGQ